MPRIKLAEQKVYEFEYHIHVRPQDVNFAGHVGNDNLISLVGDARAKLFHSLGFSELDLGDQRTGIIITDLIVNYRAEAFMFDELLVETHLGELSEKGFRMFHRIRKGPLLVALVESGFLAYSYAAKKSSPLPQSFLKRFADRNIK